MAFSNSRTQSIYGRRLGLQLMSTVQTGGSRGSNEFLVGPDAIRTDSTTANTTSSNLKCHGVHLLNSSSAGSSQVYTLDPPIAGISVTIHNSTNATAFIKTGSIAIKSSVGSTQTVISMPAAGHSITLTGVSSALWLTQTATGSGIGLTNTT